MPKFEREVEIDTPVETVWAVLTDPKHWSEWLPGVESVSNVTSVAKNGKFEWTKDGQTGQGEIVEYESGKRFKVITQMGKDKDSHDFMLKASGGLLGLGADECKVEYLLDTLEGKGIITNFVSGGNPKDALRVKKATHNLRKLVESA